MWVGHTFLDMVRLGRRYTGSSVWTLCPAYLVKVVSSMVPPSPSKVRLVLKVVVCGGKCQSMFIFIQAIAPNQMRSRVKLFSKQRFSTVVSQKVVYLTAVQIKEPTPDI